MAAKNSKRAGQMGAFAQANNHQVMSGWLNYPVFQDASGTPVTSPVALTTSWTTINVPAAAATITLIPAVAVRIADVTGGTDGYLLIPANTEVTLPVVTPTSNPNDTTGQLFLAADSTSGNCSFYFGCV